MNETWTALELKLDIRSDSSGQLSELWHNLNQR
jgi:hypothetical protein